MSGLAKKDEAFRLAKSLQQQSLFFTKKRGKSERNTRASYALSKLIAEKIMPFAEGEFVKECLMAVVDIVCPEKKSLFSNVSLSRRTVTRRIEDLAADVRGSLKDTCVGLDYFSVALGENTDLKDTAQLGVLGVFIRGVMPNLDVVEEFVHLMAMNDTTTGKDIFITLQRVLTDMILDISKLFSNTQTVKRRGFPVGKAHERPWDFSQNQKKTSLHHSSRGTVRKISQTEGVIDVVVKTVNLILSCGLNHRQFQQFLLETQAEFGDLTYFCNLRWLSRGKMLCLREEIATFLISRNKNVSHFHDPLWVSSLGFLVDITTHLNDLNLKLQGKNQLCNEM